MTELKITATMTVHYHTVKHGDRMIGQIIGNDEGGWRAQYWVPVTVKGERNGQYGVKDSPWRDDPRMNNMLLWLEDQHALYGDKPEVALRQCR